MNEFPCFFCSAPADRLGYYSKYYGESDKDTIENPTLFCESCWPLHKKEIGQVRGGREGVFYIKFDSIGKYQNNKVGFLLGKKKFEINHLATLGWRKKIWRIHLTHQPKKEREKNETDRNNLQGFPVQKQT